MSEATDRDWELSKRAAWWLKFLAAVFAMTTAVLGLGRWIYSRASIDDVARVEKQKVDIDVHEKDLERIEKRIERSDKTLGVVHTNVVRLLEHGNIAPKRLNDKDTEGEEP